MYTYEASIFDGNKIHYGLDAKLTLTVRRKRIEGIEFIVSNFNALNTSFLGAFGVILEVTTM